MSLKSSNSSEKPILPLSDPPKNQPDDKLFKGSAMTKRGAYAAISYMTCAVMLVMFNKAALSSYNFPSANVITLLQRYCAVEFEQTAIVARDHGGCSGSKCSNVYNFEEDHSGIYNACRVSFGGTEVYTLCRLQAVISVGLIIFGAFVAGARDLSFDGYGYGVVFLANISTAIYLATIARIGKTSGLNSFGLMWCNGILCGPVLLIWTFIRGDLTMTINFPYLFSPGFLVILLFSCILAFFLNYCIFLNTTLNSALTQTICGNLKDLFTIGFGWIIFGGLPFDFWNVIGQCLGFAGSGLYAYFKLIGK
ncbi:UDP-N-acetylglucosamine/UDP-glucose/GDP-mannose transporter-like protein [Trifolium pratense]|uniref:UDP-N-acetylglucosamine/UDP-glucose/GDP-mannose transporter-like protein n=1 Tax=Trifolium pratense TaxID=57577 RepID=A0A2K3MUY0_TRIPR|nr:UDP-N-acetylglucosamine/UDP-glucose/GDP-mannose transporter-like protein [Trifolium pratense]